jgi:hypothetical protein
MVIGVSAYRWIRVVTTTDHLQTRAMWTARQARRRLFRCPFRIDRICLQVIMCCKYVRVLCDRLCFRYDTDIR